MQRVKRLLLHSEGEDVGEMVVCNGTAFLEGNLVVGISLKNVHTP